MLIGYTNSNQNGSSDDHWSTSGYVFYLGTSPIAWSCKKQQVIALSSIEAECKATVNATQEALWL